jgi:hypothetical protein
VVAVAVDRAGGSREVGADAKVDLTPPVASVSCPSAWRDAPAECELSYADPESGVAERRLRVGGVAAEPAGDSLRVSEEGEQTVEAAAVNGAGTDSGWAAATTRIDLTPPVARLLCEPPTVAAPATCIASATDTGSGVAGLSLVRDGAAGAAIEAGEPFAVAGPAEIAVRAVDGVGREGTSDAVAVPAQPTAEDDPPPVEDDPPPVEDDPPPVEDDPPPVEDDPPPVEDDPPPVEDDPPPVEDDPPPVEDDPPPLEDDTAPPSAPADDPPTVPADDPPRLGPDHRPVVPAVAPPAPPARPAAPARAPLRDARGRRLATFRLGATAVVGQTSVRVTPARLPAGAWRVRACAAGRCVTRRLTQRPCTLVLRTAGAGRVTVALQRRHARGRFRTAASGAARIV